MVSKGKVTHSGSCVRGCCFDRPYQQEHFVRKQKVIAVVGVVVAVKNFSSKLYLQASAA